MTSLLSFLFGGPETVTAKHSGIGIYWVKRSRGVLWWKREEHAEAYWHEKDGWCWVESDREIHDYDTRIALNEAHLRRWCGR